MNEKIKVLNAPVADKGQLFPFECNCFAAFLVLNPQFVAFDSRRDTSHQQRQLLLVKTDDSPYIAALHHWPFDVSSPHYFLVTNSEKKFNF